MLASLIAGFASGEVMNAVRRAKSAAIAYLLAFCLCARRDRLSHWRAVHLGCTAVRHDRGGDRLRRCLLLDRNRDPVASLDRVTLAGTAHSPSRRGPRHGGRRGGRVGSAGAPEKSGRPRRAARGACGLRDLSREPQGHAGRRQARPSTGKVGGRPFSTFRSCHRSRAKQWQIADRRLRNHASCHELSSADAGATKEPLDDQDHFD